MLYSWSRRFRYLVGWIDNIGKNRFRCMSTMHYSIVHGVVSYMGYLTTEIGKYVKQRIRNCAVGEVCRYV